MTRDDPAEEAPSVPAEDDPLGPRTDRSDESGPSVHDALPEDGPSAHETSSNMQDPAGSRRPRPRLAPTQRLGTGCDALDTLLEGGLERDAVTLVFGEGGSGKTNLALQCAREAIANGQRVAFVDTEGVSADRMRQVFARQDEEIERLLFFSPFGIKEQEKMVQRSTLVRELGLVVVDSINMHYRLHLDGGEQEEREASRSLYKQLHHLTVFARREGVPVLVTGQVFGQEDATQPWARRTMEHLVKAAIRFEKRDEGVRRATIVKHRSLPEGRRALFRIGATGLVDAGAGARDRPEGSAGGDPGRRRAARDGFRSASAAHDEDEGSRGDRSREDRQDDVL